MTEPLENLSLADAPPGDAAAAALTAALERGALVGLPTECGYVIGGRADDAAVTARIGALAPAGEPTPLIHALGSAGELPVGLRLRPLLERLIARYWPGPLTLQAVDGGGDRRAFRVTAHAGTGGLIEGARRALVWTRAADSNGQTLTDADGVAAAHGNAIELLFDGGTTRLSEPAAVLSVGPGQFALEREGLLPIDDLRATAGLSIGFVCTGNTCRSPMAATLARHALTERLESNDLSQFGFEIASAGVFAGAGSPASEHAVTAMDERDLDLSGHSSTPATPDLVASLDRVYCLTASHLQALRMALPPGRADHVELLDPDGFDVPDPVGGSLDDYRRCAESIERSIASRAAGWA